MILEEKKERVRKSYNSRKHPVSCHRGCNHTTYKHDSKNEGKPRKSEGFCALSVVSCASDVLRAATWTQALSQRLLVWAPYVMV